MRKFLTFLFAALMSVGMWALTPQGEDTWDEGTKTLTVNSNPGEDAYYGVSDIKNLVISDAVTSIGEAAFSYCSGLETVTNYATTPQNIESKDVFAGVTLSGCTLSVPAESVIAYSTASVWQDFGTIAAIPEPASAWVLREGDAWDDATKTLTVNSDLPINAYKHQTVIKHVIISSGVTSIGYSAFCGCEGLKSITIPNSVTSIGVNAFCGCINLTSVTIPNSVASIAFGAFSFCIGLTSITIPEGVTSIEEGAFFECRGLTSITIPNSVKSIDKWAFIYCKKLALVTVNATTPPTLGDSPFKLTAEGLKIYVPAGSVNAYKTAWSAYADKIKAIPPAWVRAGDEWDDASKTLTVDSNLPENAYKGQTVIQHVIISSGVTSIGNGAFYNCNGLTSVTIGNSVTSIGDEAFAGCTSLTSITIPTSVTSIGKAAFYNCTGLTSIEIPNSVISIGESAFAYCTGLTSITIPTSVKSIGKWAFRYCDKLASVTVNATTPPTLGTDAFAGTAEGLKIYVPVGSVNTYKAAWSDYAAKIKAIQPAWVRADDEWDEGTKTLTVNSNLPKDAYKDQNVIQHVIISSGVTSIGNGAFDNCNGLTSITIPNSVTSIGEAAFYHCSGLPSITIPNSVTSIGEGAFSGCSGLTSVTINAESLESYGSGAFEGTAECLKIYVPAGSVDTYKAAWSAYADKIVAKWIHDGDAWDEGTKTLTVKSNLPENAYKGQTVIEHVIISSGVTSVGNAAFYECSGLTSVRCVRETPASLGNDVFYGTAAALKIYVPAGSIDTYKAAWTAYADKIQPAWVRDGDEWDEATKTLTVNSNPGNYAYQIQHVFQHVIINNGVTSIGMAAFEQCKGLTSVIIPNSVTSIGAWAFTYSSNLMSITCLREEPASFGTNAFPHGAPYDQKIYVPAGSVDAYKAAWSYVAEKIKAIPSEWVRDGDTWNADTKTLTVNSDLPYEAYKAQTVIQHVIISDAVTSIGTQAFNSCSALTSVTIGKSVTSIGDGAFAGCTGLPSITIPNSVTSIGDYTFFGCTALPSITIPKSVTSIGEGAFAACTGLTSIVVESGNSKYDSRGNCNAIIETSSNKLIVGCQYTFIPEGVTSIGEGAFAYCTGKTSITIPNSVKSIGESAFAGCSDLTSVTIGDSVTSIGDEAFYLCYGLTSIEIPNSVDSIGEGAFRYCSGLTSITIPNSVTSIGDYTFFGCSGLTSITIPNSVTSIGEGAFSGCEGLTSVTCVRETPASLGNDAFNECSNLNAIYVPCGTLDAYQSSWTQYQSNIKYAQPEYTIIGNVNIAGAGTVILPQTICDNSITASPNYGYHFAKWSDGNTENPRTIELTQDTTFTAEFAYDRTGKCGNDWALTWTYDPEGKVLTISGNGAFEQNMQCGVEARGEMTKVIFEDGVTSIGNFAFDGCTGLTSVTIGNSVTSIGQMAFFGCSHLTSVTIGNSVTSIGDNAFQNCSGLTSITIPNSVTRIGLNAFYGCTGLSSIEIPSSVTRIGGFAFDGCTALASVTIHAESLERYGAYAFDGTAAALKIYVPAGSVDTYKAGWAAYADKIVAIPAPEPAAEYAEIIFIEPVAADALATDASFALVGTTFSATITDPDNKMSIDANSCRFGGAEDYKSYSHRLKTGGKSSSKNFITLNIPAAGKLRLAVRSGNKDATDRNLVITQGEKELYNAVIQESMAIEVTEGETQVKVYPYVEVAVAAGTVRLSYPVNGLNFYSFGFMETSTPTGVDEITNGKSQTTKVIRNGQILILRDGKTYTLTGQTVK